MVFTKMSRIIGRGRAIPSKERGLGGAMTPVFCMFK
jgi:hypothetical protein